MFYVVKIKDVMGRFLTRKKMSAELFSFEKSVLLISLLATTTSAYGVRAAGATIHMLTHAWGLILGAFIKKTDGENVHQ